jgi:hypothetical protein
MTIKFTIIAACATTLLTGAPLVMAQDASPTPGASAAPSATASASVTPPATNPEGRGGGMEGFRQRMNDRIKAELKASDDEWAVIQPLLEKVQTAQMATMTGRFGFGGGRHGGRGPGGPGGSPGADGASPSPNGGNGGENRPPRPTSPEADALKAALASDATSSDEIKTKLQALRDARKKAQDNLEDARENLKKVLTLRQEATLVQMGLLD